MSHLLTTPLHGSKLALAIGLATLVFVAVMAALHPTSNAFKKRLTMLLAFLGGSFYLLEFLTPAHFTLAGRGFDNPFSPYLDPLGTAQRIFLALALMLGIVNLFRVNGRTVVRRRAGWWYALAFFVGFFAMMGVWALRYYHPGITDAAVQAAAANPTVTPGGRLGQYIGWYGIVYNGGFNALGSTMFSLLAFFIVSAAYRAFRVRSAEAILLLGSAIVMMLGLTPLGTAFVTGFIPLNSPYAFLKLESLSEWILLVLNGACQRALLFGVAVGLMATSLRIWLSLERGQFFDAEM
ncbi:MAG TPA: hypothetical protein VGM37_02955 [Armatimonadota bacterium]|jgi:hypothetical protein